ncbi:MAG: T9SS type A sorting domain-containing protein [Bacteroidetes bacterium]|nr:T9SS type A sorting domain-containing protein [Bacteroidota bacterium]
MPGYCFIIRTVDGGKHWGTPYVCRSYWYGGGTTCSTPLTSDTVIAGGNAHSSLFVSFDRGATWQLDSALLDTNYNFGLTQGLAVTSDRHIIACFQAFPLYAPGQAIIAQGQWSGQNEVATKRAIGSFAMYPNPAVRTVTVSVPLDAVRYRLYDLLGRQVTMRMVSGSSTTTVDLSALSPGVYSIVFETDRGQLITSKFVVSR